MTIWEQLSTGFSDIKQAIEITFQGKWAKVGEWTLQKLIFMLQIYHQKRKKNERIDNHTTNTFIENCLTVYIKRDDIYKEIAEYVETRFDNTNYVLDRPLLEGKNKKVTRLMSDKLGRKIVEKCI